MDKAGRTNNYLVSGAYFDRPEGVYPQGEEREQLFLLFDILMKTIKNEYNIGDFKAWTDERVDEYIALAEEKDKEKTKRGVIVDEETKVLVDEVNPEGAGDVQQAKDKLRELLVMLKLENKMEMGGSVNENGYLINKLNDYLITL